MSELSQELVERGREGAEARGAGETRVGVASTLPAGSSDVATAPTVALPQGAQPAGPLTPVSTQPASGRWSTARLPVVERGAYAPLGEVAQGGIGRVLSAHDERLCRTVAIKELLEAGGAAEERFVREALLTARLQHPSIVPVYEAGRWPTGEPFYAMKLVSGRPLSEVIAEHRSLDGRLPLLPHVLSVAEAVAYAHEKRIIHRDLKPANVLVGAFGETVVIDWGLGKDLAEEGYPESAEGAPSSITGEGLTMQGAVMGTPAYMPPEQAAGEAVDERADVYALGAILYHLLSGAAPYDAPTSMAILDEVLRTPPPALRARQPGIPDDLLAIVDKAMARDPAARYPCAQHLAEDLRRFLAGQLVVAHRYTPRERALRFVRKHRAAFSVAGAALLILAVMAALGIAGVVRERNLARQRQEETERAQKDAEDARRRAATHADELTMAQARSALERDPNEALAWLRTLSPTFDAFGAARILAGDAAARGISVVLRGHQGAVNRVAFSRDGRMLGTSSDDRTARLWAPDGRLLALLEGHTDEVWALAFSPDGQTLATSGKDRTARLWDVPTGTSRVLASASAPVKEVAFSPDGRLLFTTTGNGVELFGLPALDERYAHEEPNLRHFPLFAPDHPAAVVRVRENRFVERLDTESGALVTVPLDAEILALAVHAGQKLFAGGATDGRIFLVDLERGEARFLGGLPILMRALAFSPDGDALAGGGEDGSIVRWDLATGAVRSLGHHDGPVGRLLHSPDGRRLASSSDDHTVRLWDLATGDARVLRGFQDATHELAFSPDGTLLAASSADGTARIFRVLDPATSLLRAQGGPVLAGAFSPRGDAFATCARDGVVRLFALPAAEPVALAMHAGACRALAFSPDGALIASAGDDGAVRIVTREGIPLRDTAMSGAPLRALRFTPDGARVAAAGVDGAIRLIDVRAQGERVLYGHAGPVRAMAVAPGGEFLISGGEDGVVRVWDLETGETRVMGRHAGPVLAVAVAPGGERVASGGEDRALRLWEGTRGPARTLEVGGRGLTQLVFSPDGALLAGTGGDADARVWEVATGALRRVLRGHEGEVLGCHFAPSGDALATASADRTARLWDLESGEGRVLARHAGAALGVVFAPDGQSIASLGEDGVVILARDDLPRDPAAFLAYLRDMAQDEIPGHEESGKRAHARKR
jgi:WD40 repeat protein